MITLGALLLIISALLLLGLTLGLFFVGMEKNRDKDVDVVTPTATFSATEYAIGGAMYNRLEAMDEARGIRATAVVPDPPDRQGMLPNNLQSPEWVQYPAPYPYNLTNSQVEGNPLAGEAPFNIVFQSNLSSGKNWAKTASTANNWGSFGGQAIDSSKTGTSANCGYFYSKSLFGKQGSDYETSFTKCTIILPFIGQGIGFMMTDSNYVGTGARIVEDGCQQISYNNKGDYLTSKPKLSNIKRILKPPINNTSLIPSFFVVNWVTNADNRAEMTFKYVQRTVNGTYQVQGDLTSSPLLGKADAQGFIIYVPGLDKGPTLWGGTNVFPGTNLDNLTLINACSSWETFWDPVTYPEIFTAPTPQEFWVAA